VSVCHYVSLDTMTVSISAHHRLFHIFKGCCSILQQPLLVTAGHDLLLRSEPNGARPGIHGLQDGQGFQMIAPFPDGFAAGLEALFNDDTAALHHGTGSLRNGDQSLQRAAVGQKIIDDQDVLAFPQESSGHDDLVFGFVGKGFHLGSQHLPVQVYKPGLFGKHHGNTKFSGHKGGRQQCRRPQWSGLWSPAYGRTGV